MIYLCEDMASTLPAEIWSTLPPQRRAKAMRYRRSLQQRQSALAYLMLRYGLLKEYGIYLSADLELTAEGKPVLSAYRDVYISISHCDQAVAVVIANRPIGIDVESICRYDNDVAQRCCSDEQMQLIASATDPGRCFTQLWTMKESQIKLLGKAPADLRALPSPAARFFTVDRGSYLLSTCSDTAPRHPLCELTVRDVSP